MSKNYKTNGKAANVKQKPIADKRPQAQKKSFNSDKFFRWTPFVYAILFAIFSFYVLVGLNSDYLFNVQEHSLWINDPSFWNLMVVRPGGFITWAGCFFTQFFYYPALGASILIAMWLIIYFLTIKAFRISSKWSFIALIPIAALLCSIVDLGYWLYYAKIPGYWFCETLGLLISMLGLLAGRRTLGRKNSIATIVWMVVVTFICYILTGWWALLATICLTIMCLVEKVQWRWILLGLGILAIIAVPIIAYQFYTQIQIKELWWAGFPLFAIDFYISWIKSVPFFAIIGICILCSFSAWIEKGTKEWKMEAMVPLFVIVAAFIGWWVLTVNFDDNNYHREMRVYRAANEGNWNEVLREAAENPDRPTREIVLLKNIALMYKGTIGNEMFRYSNFSIKPYVDDSLKVHMVQTNAPLVYMLYGRANFSTRWTIENGTEWTFNADGYKIMARCAILAQEMDVAQKYLDILKKTTFQKEWVKEYEPMLTDTLLIEKHPVLGKMKDYYSHFRSVLDGDEGLVEMYLLNYFSQTQNKDSKLLQETTLVFSLISKDIQRFWPKFFLYATLHSGEEMPIHYQEAAYLYGNLEHEVDIRTMPFDPQRIVNRYANFHQTSQTLLSKGYSTEQVGEMMQANYGDTFWWFYFFCRDVQSY